MLIRKAGTENLANWPVGAGVPLPLRYWQRLGPMTDGPIEPSALMTTVLTVR